MDYREIMELLVFGGMVAVMYLFARRLRRADLDPMVRIIALLFVGESMAHFVASADYLIGALYHNFAATVFDWDAEVMRDVLEGLRSSAQMEGFMAAVFAVAWYTGIPVAVGFSKATGKEKKEQSKSIKVWESAALFICLLFFFSCVMRIVIYSVPLL